MSVTMDQLNKHARRLQGDPVGDQMFQYLKQESSVFSEFMTLPSNQAFWDYLTKHPELKQLLGKSFTQNSHDIEEFNKGVIFFERHVSTVLTVLGLYSLPYCYCGKNGARVLVTSNKIIQQPEKRLAETAEFVMDVCDRQGFDPEGKAYLAIAKVRAMHAAARYYAKRSIKDEEPVNQDDMLATLLSFSLIVIRGLRKMGVSVSNIEAEAFLYMWNVIGLKLGIEQVHLPKSIREASRLERDITKREFATSDEGVRLTQSLLHFLNSQRELLKLGVSAEDLMNYFLGSNAQLLGIEPGKATYQGLVDVVIKTSTFIRSFSEISYNSVKKQISREVSALNAEQ